MDTKGMVEDEWRKTSSCAEEVGRIKPKYSRLLQLIKKVAAEQELCVPELSMEVNHETAIAVIKTFAGQSSIRLGWDASGEELAGVAIVSSVKHADDAPTDILKVYMPAWSENAYMRLENGERVKMDSNRTGEFAYIVLMSIVRKQVDLSA